MPDALSLLDPIHLPSPRGKGTPVALPGSFGWTLLSPNIDDFGLHICGTNVWDFTIQALDVIEGGGSTGCRPWQKAPLGTYPHPSHPLIHPHQYKGDPRALIANLNPSSSGGWDWPPRGLGSPSIAPSQVKATALGNWGPASYPSPLNGRPS